MFGETFILVSPPYSVTFFTKVKNIFKNLGQQYHLLVSLRSSVESPAPLYFCPHQDMPFMFINVFQPDDSKKGKAGLAQLGERQTEDLKVMCSIHITRNFFNISVKK